MHPIACGDNRRMTRFAPIACATAVLALLAGSAGAEVSSTARAEPTLRLLRTTPVVVAGARFLPRERVTVRLSVNEDRRLRRVTATSTGRFTVTFDGVAVYDRCNSRFRIWAVGARGSEAELKMPQLLCPPAP
jgi:hypothetical protein